VMGETLDDEAHLSKPAKRTPDPSGARLPVGPADVPSEDQED
jgi:hypothetical protein